MLSLLPTALRILITSFLWKSEQPIQETRLSFHLRHEHAVSNSSRIIFADVPHALTASEFAPSQSIEVGTRRVKAHRPLSHSAFMNARLRGAKRGECESLKWDEVDIVGPDVEDRATLLTLAKMTHNAYEEPSNKDWYDLSPDWNAVSERSICLYSLGQRFLATELPLWLGTRCRWIPWPCVCVYGQCDCRGIYQGHVSGMDCWWHWTYGEERQAQRQPSLLVLLCARRTDLVHSVRLLLWVA